MRNAAVLFSILVALPAWGDRKHRTKKKERPPPAVLTAPEATPPAEADPDAAPASQAPAPAEEAAPTPTPAPAPPAPRAPAPTAADLEQLRAEYEQLRDTLFRSRARART